MSWLRGQDLNLRLLGYEPNELPDCSTPHNHLNVPFTVSSMLTGKHAHAAFSRRLRISFINSCVRNGLRTTGNFCSAQISSSTFVRRELAIRVTWRRGAVCTRSSA